VTLYRGQGKKEKVDKGQGARRVELKDSGRLLVTYAKWGKREEGGRVEGGVGDRTSEDGSILHREKERKEVGTGRGKVKVL
jgi:hypothetical protein